MLQAESIASLMKELNVSDDMIKHTVTKVNKYVLLNALKKTSSPMILAGDGMEI